MYINNPGRMTKMVAMPIYVKTFQKSCSADPVNKFQQNLAMYHYGQDYCNVYETFYLVMTKLLILRQGQHDRSPMHLNG